MQIEIRKFLPRRAITAIAAAILAPLAAGCLPIPHTSEKFPAMRGHVVDAATGQPLSGASVAVHDHPATIATTDSNGAFHFARKVNLHLAVTPGPCPTSWPEGTEWSEQLDITRPGYQPRQVDARDLVINSPDQCDDAPDELRDIALTPTTRPSQ